MLTKLAVDSFKNFRKAELKMGPLTLLVGTNASGKSNLRDAFRFLHGISRRYSLADVIGEKWGEGGVLQWRGIRGGVRETAYPGQKSFEVKIETEIRGQRYSYAITIDIGDGGPPRVIRESLKNLGRSGLGLFQNIEIMIFDSHPSDDPPDQGNNPAYLFVRLPRDSHNRKHGKRLQFISSQPVLTQIVENKEAPKRIKDYCEMVISSLASMRFLDLSVDAMRIPSLPGQVILGDRGENLSSVLQSITSDPKKKNALLQWIQELTPMDARDFEFPADQTGRILVSLVEGSGQKISAYSASDGTLRFLAMIAALIGPEPARFYFFEELENGIHPTRLHLLIQMLESRTREGSIQVVATTHSPQLLTILNMQSLENVSLVYRLEQTYDARIKALLDVPTARNVIKEQDMATLLSTGWLEDAVAFTEDGEVQQ